MRQQTNSPVVHAAASPCCGLWPLQEETETVARPGVQCDDHHQMLLLNFDSGDAIHLWPVWVPELWGMVSSQVTIKYLEIKIITFCILQL